MDAVKMMGEVIRESAELTADRDCIGPAKLVVFCNAVEDNPFMAGAFHGISEPDCVIHVGVSGPGVVHAALKKCDGDLGEVAEIIKKNGHRRIMEDEAVRAHFVEEMTDVLMYYGDVMNCFSITPEELGEAYRAKFRRNMERW